MSTTSSDVVIGDWIESPDGGLIRVVSRPSDLQLQSSEPWSCRQIGEGSTLVTLTRANAVTLRDHITRWIDEHSAE